MSFEAAVKFVLDEEGLYVNDPKDKGGETNFGVSKRAYPQLDIKNLTEAEAIQIYHMDYWSACKCDSLPPKLALVVFDTAVNQGVGAATKMLQASVGAVQDGIIGSNTIERANAVDEDSIVCKFLTYRILRYCALPTFATYGRGWLARTIRVAMR